MNNTSIIPVNNTRSRSSHMTELINKCPHTEDGKFIVNQKGYDSVRELAEDLEAGYDALCSRLRDERYNTIEEAIAKPFRKITPSAVMKKFYNKTACGSKGGYIVYGKHYPSIRAIEKEYELLNGSLYRQACKDTTCHSLEKLLETALLEKDKEVSPHARKYADDPDAKDLVFTVYGQQFHSISEIARHYNKPLGGFEKRIIKGKYPSIEAILEKDFSTRTNQRGKYQITDKKGNPVYAVHGKEFTSLKQLCTDFQINYFVFTGFLYRHSFSSLEEAVECYMKIRENTTFFLAYGEEYDSLIEIAEIYRVIYPNLASLTPSAKTDATPDDSIYMDSILDSMEKQDTVWHLYADDPEAEFSTYTIHGITYRSIYSAAKEYGHTPVTVYAKLLNGTTLEDAVSNDHKEPFHVFDKSYDSVTALSKLSNVSESGFCYRIMSGMYTTLEDVILNMNKRTRIKKPTSINRLPSFVQTCINNRTKSQTTKSRYACSTLRFLEFLIHTEPSFSDYTPDCFTRNELIDLGNRKIEAFKDYLENDPANIISAKTVENHLNTIKQLFCDLEKQDNS